MRGRGWEAQVSQMPCRAFALAAEQLDQAGSVGKEEVMERRCADPSDCSSGKQSVLIKSRYVTQETHLSDALVICDQQPLS